jgi:hypothetical protein
MPDVEQPGLPFGTVQLVVHEPQVDGCVRLASHPLAGDPSQLPKPGLHIRPQLPAVQVRLAFALEGHTVPQPPQWSRWLSVSTQLPEQRERVAGEQPVAHEPAMQTGAMGPQDVVHDPQVIGRLRSASQPFDGVPSQSA